MTICVFASFIKHYLCVLYSDIPHFKDIVVMATSCDACGHKTNEIKSGAGIEEKGVRMTLKVMSEDDLKRDVVKVRIGIINANMEWKLIVLTHFISLSIPSLTHVLFVSLKWTFQWIPLGQANTLQLKVW
jgi:ZPR1 zinc-finger domain